MSKVRNLPEITVLADEDLVYAVDESVGTNGGRKITKANLKENLKQSPTEIKTAYESNADTNAYTDAEKSKLAGIEPGATADQDAIDVPFNNTGTDISATNVEDAIKEVNEQASAEFRASVVSGRIVRIAAGNSRFDGVFYAVPQTDVLVDANATNVTIYVDTDGVVKLTASNVEAPPYTIIVARVTTDATTVLSLVDRRVKSAQNTIRGLLSDVRDVRAGAAADAGTSNRVSDAAHKHNILTAAPSTQIPDQANAEGSSISLARADHVHNIPTDVPVQIGTSNSQGVANSFAKSDHVHRGVHSLKANAGTMRYGDTSLQNGVGTTITDDGAGNFTVETTLGGNELRVTQGPGLQANYSAGRVRINGTRYEVSPGSLIVATGASDGRIYVDVDGIVKSTTSSSAPPNTVTIAAYSSNLVTILALSDVRTVLNGNTVFGSSGDISTITPNGVAAAGSSNKYADAGHNHPIAVGLAGDITTIQPDDTASAGTADKLARADHRHAIAAAAPSTQNPDQANTEGVSTSFARADHIHNIPADAPVTTLSPATSNTEGTGNSFARHDHVHAIATALVGDITTIQPDAAASAGTANTFARGDHRHAIDAAVPVNTGSANSEGVSTSFARADHVHNTTIANNSVRTTSTTSTTSGTDVLLASMTLTPAAGTYLVLYEGIATQSNNSATMTFSFYVGGVQVTNSERSAIPTNAVKTSVTNNAIVTVNGSQAIEVRYRTTAGTTTVDGRSITIVRLGD